MNKHNNTIFKNQKKFEEELKNKYSDFIINRLEKDDDIENLKQLFYPILEEYIKKYQNFKNLSNSNKNIIRFNFNQILNNFLSKKYQNLQLKKRRNSLNEKLNIFKETSLNFQAPISYNQNSLTVAVISFNTEAIELKNSRLEEGKGNKIQEFYKDNYKVKSKGFSIGNPFFKGGDAVYPMNTFKKPDLEYIRKIINQISNIGKDFPDLIFFGLQESNMTPGQSDKSLQSMLYELNNKLFKNNNNKEFYSLYRSGTPRIGKEGYRGNRLGIFVRGTVELSSFEPDLKQEFNKTDCGKESAIIFDKIEDNKIRYKHFSGKSETSPKFFCDSLRLKGLFKKYFERQRLFSKSNNYGYLSVNKNNKTYKFSVMNLHLPFIKKDIKGEFGAEDRDKWLNEIYKNMYSPGTTLLLMGDLNYRFVGDNKHNSLGHIKRFNFKSQEGYYETINNKQNNKHITCPLKKENGYSFLERTFKNGTPRSNYGICDRMIYKQGEDTKVSKTKLRGKMHSNEVMQSDHALVFSVFKIS